MIHPIYNSPGTKLSLPEISSVIGLTDANFVVIDVFQGGMGICLHLASSDGSYHLALKSPLPELIGDPSSYARFLDELQVWLSVSPCNFIAEAIAVVSINDLPCVCATWMTGGDYSSKIAELPPTLQISNLLRIVRGLRWAYDNHGIIHRDLKPQNLLLDDSYLAYVADWGLARPVAQQLRQIHPVEAQGLPGRLDKTAAGSFLGTVLYAAPEQIRGSKDIDFRADVYALGCIMFEMLTGSPPFAGATREIVAYHHLHTCPPKPSARQNASIPGLDAVITRCLQKEPGDRYATYALLEVDLLRISKNIGVNEDNIILHERYRRNVIGRGDIKNLVGKDSESRDTKIKFFDLDKVMPHIEEAQNLISLSRYEEARIILEKFYHPEFLSGITEWIYLHDVALSLALCITRIDNSPDKALEIFNSLSALTDKPAEFYVNYSLALLREGNHNSNLEAARICERGLRHYPNDLDIIGNRTIALMTTGDLESALVSAITRLQLRRDIHSLEEAASILKGLITRHNGDLPKVLDHARMALDLIVEGLSINPDFDSLRLLRLEILMQAGLHLLATRAYKNLNDCPPKTATVMQAAYCLKIELLDTIGESKDALKSIREEGQKITKSPFKEKLRFLDNDIIAKNFMIGKLDANGNRMIFPSVVSYFLEENYNGDGYTYPCQAARILEWLNREDEAINILSEAINQTPDSWVAANNLGQMLSRRERHAEAVQWADYIIKIRPWEIESYDISIYIYTRAGDKAKAALLEEESNRVFAEAERLRTKFTELATQTINIR